MKKKSPSFEEAINAASLWCNAWDQGELSDEILADRISELLETKNGSRGFFAFSLSSNIPLMDRLPDALIFQLRESGETVVEITVKNFAMSTAMATHHKLNHNQAQKARSENVQRRCIELLRLLETHSVKKRLEILLEGTKGTGKDVEFLKRWNYNDLQKKEIAKAINLIPEN